MSNQDSLDSDRHKFGFFPDTLWSIVAVAGRAGSSQSDAARGFLLSNLQYYMLDEPKRTGATKRGGNVTFVPFDTEEADSRYMADSASGGSPDSVFKRQWAITVMQRAADILGEAWKREGKGEVFEALRAHLLSPMDAAATRQIAGRFHMSESHVKVSLHRLRERYSTELRKEVADTVTSVAEVDDELAALRAAIG